MHAKGSAVIVTPAFVKAHFTVEQNDQWLATLSPDVRQLFESAVLLGAWYDLQKYLIVPTEKMCKLFFNNNLDGSFLLGRFGADYSLKGVYKLFVRLVTHEFTLRKASQILPKYFDQGKIDFVSMEKQRAVLRIFQFPEMHAVIEQRIAGWASRALEINHGKNAEVQITASLLSGYPYTELVLSWE